MKKFLSIIFLLAISVSVFAQSSTPRWGGNAKDDNTGRVLTYNVTTALDAAGNDTVFSTPNAWETIIRIGALTDSINFKCLLTTAKLGDKLSIFVVGGGSNGGVRFPSTYFVNDATANRYTIAAGKTAMFHYRCNGTKWIMQCKMIQP